jgi:hypothetical protein
MPSVVWPTIVLCLTATLGAPLPAQEQAAPGKAAEPIGFAAASQAWEDVLLLEAVRYLHLSQAQLQQILPLAKTEQQRLGRLEEENEETIGKLKSQVGRYREAVAGDQTGAGQILREAHALARTLQRKREMLDDQHVQFVARRLVRILTPKQTLQAYLLSMDKVPEGVSRSPALFNRASGFVLNADEHRDWRRNLEMRALAGRYPAQLFDAQMHPMYQEVRGGLHQPNMRRNPEEQALADILLQYAPETMDALMRDRMSIGERWRNLRDQRLEGATEQERAQAIELFVRRLFLSRRIKPALEELTRKGRPAPSIP